MLLRIDSTGGRRAVRKPPFCRMRRFFVNDVFLIDSALTSFLLRRKFAFWRPVIGTFPFITFLAHSTTHLCSIPRRALNLSTNAPLFTPLERIRSESLREKCLFSVATLRPSPVEGRLTDNCTVPASRLYTLRRQTGRSSDTSVSRDLQTD